MIRHRLVLSILLLLCAFSSYSQTALPRIAVIPFNPIGVAKNEAEAITGLFETALVKTGSFTVTEQSQIHEILKAQEISLSDCSSTECAVQVGQLLSAEQIVLGSLSSVGGKVILNARIVDVAKGVNLKADKVEASALSGMIEGAEVLAYKLAGLTYTRGSQLEIAREFGEVFVETDPPGADILVNGVKKGVSPVLVSQVPVGYVQVESRKGSLYAKQEVRVGSQPSRLTLTLTQQSGSLYIRSSAAAVQVLLDGSSLGPLGTGFFEKIPVGTYTLELKGVGLYWSGEVAVRAGASTQVEASPRAFGSIRYSLPAGVRAEIQGEGFQKVVEGSGELYPVWEGRYRVETSSSVYEPYIAEVSVTQGRDVTINPTLQYTREYEQQEFRRLVDQAEGLLSDTIRVEQSHIDQVVGIKGKIQSSRYGFPDLVARSELLITKLQKKKENQDKREQLSALVSRQNALEQRISRIEGNRKSRKTAQWLSLGTGVLGLGVSGVCMYFAGEAYQNYVDATITTDVIRYRDEVAAWKTGIFISWGIGGAGLGNTLLLWATRPKVSRYQSELNEVRSCISTLEGQLK